MQNCQVAETRNDLELTPRKQNLFKRLRHQNKKLKRLQSKTRYLTKKVAGLKEILKDLHEKLLISKDEQIYLEKIGVENRELSKRQMMSKKGKLTRKQFSP